mmetsp:Transcript_26387/g.44558  ORF Transcript_26387/g.44558 Transcript_26387/m.44558 type:complete len:142 (-) Transcript_26387:816-1241(-)
MHYSCNVYTRCIVHFLHTTSHDVIRHKIVKNLSKVIISSAFIDLYLHYINKRATKTVAEADTDNTDFTSFPSVSAESLLSVIYLSGRVQHPPLGQVKWEGHCGSRMLATNCCRNIFHRNICLQIIKKGRAQHSNLFNSFSC